MWLVRKPVLPVELQLNGSEHDPNSRSDIDIDIDAVVAQMFEKRQKLFNSASENIKKTQMKYKEYYDKKRVNPEV